MLLVTAFVLHQVLVVDASQAGRRAIGQGITVGLVVVSVITCRTNNLAFHSVVFGAMIFVIGVKTIGLIERLKDPQRRGILRRSSRVGAGK